VAPDGRSLRARGSIFGDGTATVGRPPGIAPSCRQEKALAILVVGWLVAKGISIGTKRVLDKTEWDNGLAARMAHIVRRLATSLLSGIGFDRLPEWLGLGAARTGRGSASAIAGYVILTILLFLGGVQAFETLGLGTVSSLAEQLLAGLFNIVVAVVIFGVGLFLSRVAHKAIAPSGQGQSALLGNVARAAILIFTGAMALSRAGLASDIVTLAFGALIVGLALAFGLGGREEAARTIASRRAKG
jgi:hypothetical protein